MADQPALRTAVDRPAMRRVARPRSLTALVLEQIREMIVSGRLALGEQLSENVLAEELGVSRTPVREAFMRLESERLVEVRPQRGTFVFQCSDDEVRDICELREILEAGALRVALARNRDRLLAVLEQNIEAGRRWNGGSPITYQAVDQGFHAAILEGSGNPTLIEAYRLIAAKVSALRHRLVRTSLHAQGSQADHALVVARIRAGDDAGAEAALRHHVYSSYRGMLALLRKGGSLEPPAA